MSPEQFREIKQKIQVSSILSDKEKQEWLALLPRMSETETHELDRILSVRMPTTSSNVDAITHRAFLRHLREHKDRGLKRPPHPAGVREYPLPNRERGILNGSLRGPGVIPAAPSRPELNYLSSLTVADLRRPPSIYVSLENMHKQIANTVEAKVGSSAEIIAAFEKSPLYHDYLQTGIALINRKQAVLSHEEFEALTDFRGSLKKL